MVASDSSGTLLRRKRVLVAEDEALVGLLACSAIEALGGVPLGPASSVAAALAAIECDGPDLVVLDMHLKSETSAEVVLAAQTSGIPILLSSGSAQGALPSPFDRLPRLSKPWTDDDFALAVQALLVPAVPGA
jgi:CheY-like chemotaxis protein